MTFRSCLHLTSSAPYPTSRGWGEDSIQPWGSGLAIGMEEDQGMSRGPAPWDLRRQKDLQHLST